MPTKLRWLLALGAIVALALTVSACGDDDSSSTTTAPALGESEFAPPTEAPDDAQEGGDLTVIAASDVDYIDPGAAYYQFTYMVTSATQSPLEGYAPDDVEEPTPLLATEAPDGLRGRQDDHLHDPRRRQVLAAGRPHGDRRRRQVRDRALAAARASRTATCRPTWPASTGIDEAVKAGPGRPDRRRARHQRDHRDRRHDARDQAHRHELARRDRRAHAAGLRPGAGGVREGVRRREPVDLRREPGRDRPVHDRERLRETARLDRATRRTRRSTWSATRTGTASDGDFRPAYLDEITIQEGFADTVSASRRSSTGSAQVNGDFSAPPTVDQAGGDLGRGGPADADPERR